LTSSIAELGKCFDDGRGERSEIAQLFGDNGVDHIQIQASVFVHGHVAEADHVLHSGCQIGWYDARCLQRGKSVTTVLWHAKLPLAHAIHGEVDGGFAGPLQIQDDGVLFGLIRDEVLLVPCIFVQNALEAPLDGAALLRTTSSAMH
jgi:hypothetical protein